MPAKSIRKKDPDTNFSSQEEREWGVENAPNIAKMIKSRRLRWVGRVPIIEEGRSA